MKRPPPRSLRARALQWLAQREHSRVELRRKLLRAADEARRAAAAAASTSEASEGSAAPGPAPTAAAAPADPIALEAEAEAEVDAVLDWLEAHRYLSTERFVESRVQARAARFGNLRIRHELGQHALSLGPDTERALTESELDRARAVRERKFGVDTPATAEQRARQARFLAARGFSTDAIRGALRAGGRGED
jgi:regulatory protein